MSSLLTFPQPDHSTFKRAKEYFRGRPNYTFQDNQIDFDNEETGCGFTIEFDEPNLAVCFVLNYNRPKPFIREGIAEVSEFNKAFPGKFLNEETDNLEDFDARCYLANWSRVNDDFIRKLSSESNWYQFFAPSAILEKVWAWNTYRQDLQRKVGDDLFVASVIWLKKDETTAIPHILWADSVRTLFPDFIDCFALGTSRKIGWSLYKRKAEPETEYRIVSGSTVYAKPLLSR